MSVSSNSKRRQIFLAATGGYNTLQIREVDIPETEPNEVLVEVKAAGLNFFDIYIRHGLGLDIKPPCVLGLECSGIVQCTGEKVTRVKKGDHVVVHCPKGGAFSDYVVTNQENVLYIPPSIDFDVAASLTINYLTAYFTLIEIGGLRTGSSLLIQSAAGGVGWAATQIAKMYTRHVTVFGVASASKHSEIKDNGVDHPLTYEQNLKEEVLKICPEGVSIVLENLAGKSFGKSQEFVAPLGKVIIIGAKNMVKGETRSLWNMFRTWWETKNVSPHDLIMESKAVAGFNLNYLKEKSPQKFHHAWQKMVKGLKEGKIRPRVDSVFLFDDIEAACKRIDERKNIGKVILRPRMESTDSTS